MAKRKLIAVAALKIHDEYHRSVINGIIKQANHLGYNVAVFTMLMCEENLTVHQRAEMNIFNLINFDKVDGLIIVDYDVSPIGDYAPLFIEMLREKSTVPTIVADNTNDFLDYVIADDYNNFKRVVNHMIEVHNYKDIFCYTGPKTHFAAKARTRAFIDAMTEHGLECGEDRIFEGDFWIESAADFGMRFVNGELRVPEAILCQNDYMAVSVTNKLTDYGIKVPGDVAVTGFDGLEEAKENIPSITTLAVSGVNTGMRSVCRIHKMITGEYSEPIDGEEGVMIIGSSCGCSQDVMMLAKKRKEHLDRIMQKRFDDFIYAHSYMLEKLTDSHDMDECVDKIKDFTSIIRDENRYYLCLGENWNADVNYQIEGYAENMMTLVSKNGENFTNIYDYFQSGEMFPLLWADTEEPLSLYFTPLHFNDRCFGYSISSFKTGGGFGECYLNWNRNVSNALEFIRIREGLSTANSRLYLMSVRDELTGIYNRKGFYHAAEPMLGEAISKHKKLLLISADVDGLKYVNDTFGHIEGDRFISAAAKILKSVCSQNEICARCGGDEFMIIGCAEYNNNACTDYLEKIRGIITQYNNISGKPYKLDISVGAVCVYPDEKTTLRKLMQKSDELMYADKAAHKSVRGEKISV